jgi:multicomponent Na+:H+ antiporter subunit D
MMQSVYLIALPLLLAFASMVFKKLSKPLLLLGSLSNAAMVFLIERGDDFLGGYEPPYGIVLHLADYGYYSLVVLNLSFALLMMIALSRTYKIAPVLLISLASLNGLVMTGDLFNLFVFLEISSIASFIIVSAKGRFADVFNYMVMAIVGSLLYLLGVVLLYSTYGTLNMVKIHQLMALSPLKSQIPVILIFAGIAVEVKLAPFNGWVKNILGNSDELSGPLIGSIYASVMLLVFGRLFTDVLVLDKGLVKTLTMVALFTMLAGETAAFDSRRIREILLYSSVAQSGLSALLFLNGYASAALLSVFGNVVSKFIMYFIAGRIWDQGASDDVNELSGSFADNKAMGLAFTLASLSMSGLPLFYGFVVKVNVLYNIFMSGGYLLPVFILVDSLVEGAYMIRMIGRLWNVDGWERAPRERIRYSFGIFTRVSVLALSLLLVVLGLLPGGVTELAGNASEDLSQGRYSYEFNLEGGSE